MPTSVASPVTAPVVDLDVTSPEPGESAGGFRGPLTRPPVYAKVLTGVFLFAPFVALAVVIAAAITGNLAYPWFAVVLTFALIVVFGHGITIGFHLAPGAPRGERRHRLQRPTRDGRFGRWRRATRDRRRWWFDGAGGDRRFRRVRQPVDDADAGADLRELGQVQDGRVHHAEAA